MISLLCLAAATLVGNSPAISPIPHPEDSIVKFVSNNFSTFVSKYNETHEDDLVATKLIRTREITLSAKAIIVFKRIKVTFKICIFT